MTVQTTAPALPNDQPASAAGVRAWADLMGRAALRLRTSDLMAPALADGLIGLLDDEVESADACRGRNCPRGRTVTGCPIEDARGEADEPGHHHCRWCTAWADSWERPEPPMVQAARFVLEAS